VIELFSDPATWVALLSLTALEIVLGIDNIVFIAILTDRLPPEQRRLAYRLGLGVAMLSRIALLFAISWLQRLTSALFTVFGNDISGRDLVLLLGGLFLIYKSAQEIYTKVEKPGEDHDGGSDKDKKVRLWGVIAQIMVLDLVFSLDSVITAVGVADDLEVMVIAVVMSVAVMLVFAPRIGKFVNNNPSMKILALSFLLLIGVLLTAEAFDQHIDKGYIYFAMAFAVSIEALNIRFRKKSARLSALMKHGEELVAAGGPPVVAPAEATEPKPDDSH
jgi:predicted tellurium resistance membrane protein TerC